MHHLKSKSEDNFKVAEWAEDNDCFDAAVNRYYYYLFQKIKLFLIKNKKGYRTNPNNKSAHVYTIKQFIEYVKDKLNKKEMRYVRKLWDVKKRRNISDYSDNKRIFGKSRFSNLFKNNFDKVKKVVNKLT